VAERGAIGFLVLAKIRMANQTGVFRGRSAAVKRGRAVGVWEKGKERGSDSSAMKGSGGTAKSRNIIGVGQERESKKRGMRGGTG